MKELDLIHRIKKDDSEAFDILFKEHYRTLVRYIRSLNNDLQLAEDVAQQVFINLWINRESIIINKSVKGYLFSAAYTTYINDYRKTRRRLDLLENFKSEITAQHLSENKDDLEQKVKRLKKLIETLPPICKKVLELNKFEGLKYEEIATKLNISKKTVESHMRVAFKKIRDGFGEDNILLFFIRRVVNIN
ncbi:RNA polymerase sigma-70 factor [Aestuariibaculum sp. M13]|uniref:RNA polymerase sigma factor n=1 Tax=Aestuariibaculum sp. M13 TaxID=2967132 RepID=UPI002159D3B7|nr:RNA polymerase sigma-70 factor [Aestuariibaculum sp. M13]MCR8668938.1 RNA polymerase sigma-70 factor [Aestuariibaculum sp. M13]